tara:strand:+ start:603 stop:773 length:171 start_codon:yes stop_codon:yes gene_type:complete
MTQDKIEHIDEAVNILMDEILRPDLGIDEDSDMDDEVYSFLHNSVKELIMNYYKTL